MEKKRSQVVGLGDRVTLKNLNTNEVFTYTLGSPSKADPAAGIISSESPLAQGIHGLKEGESTTFPVKDISLKVEILKIEPSLSA